MVVYCWVKCCRNRADKSVKRSFHYIPKVRVHEGEQTLQLSIERRRVWLANINRKQEPSDVSRICSDHFVSGKPADLYDTSHPDWAPTLKLTDTETALKRYKRAKERSRTKHKHRAARALLDPNIDPEPEFIATPIYDTILDVQPLPIEMSNFCFSRVKTSEVQMLQELEKRQLTLRETNQTHADVQQMLTIKNEVSPENWSSSQDQKAEKLPQIKEEQEESDIIQFAFSPVPVKSEDDEEKPLLFKENRDSVDPDQCLKSDPGVFVFLFPAAVQQMVVVEKKICPENCNFRLGQEDQETPQIKEEQEESDIMQFTFNPVPVKSENDKWEPQSSEFHLNQTEENKDSVEPDRFDSESKISDFSETDVSEGSCRESLKRQSGLNSVTTFTGFEDEPAHDSGGKMYSCPESNLRKYNRIHTGKNPLSCSVCKQDFKLKNTFVQHMQSHKGETPLSCSVCGQTFSSQESLTSHTKIHTEEKPFGCSVCTKAFRKKSDLVKHTRVHTGERPYKCSFCNAAFKSNRSLAEHTRIHTGERPYCCTICGLGYRQKSCLTGHMRLHTGERPFSCSICKETFRWRNCLQLHKKTKCENQSFRCSVCEAPFGREQTLVEHMKIHTVVV